MNPRNVAALHELLGALTTKLTNEGHSGDTRRLAQGLASAGVLAPSAMTDREAFDTGYLCDKDVTTIFQTPPEYMDNVRHFLEQIARGESQGGNQRKKASQARITSG